MERQGFDSKLRALHWGHHDPGVRYGSGEYFAIIDETHLDSIQHISHGWWLAWICQNLELTRNVRLFPSDPAIALLL